MKTRHEFITDAMISSLDHLSTGQLGQLFSWLMLTYAQRHGLLQEDIDAHKRAMRDAKPERLIAEQLRIERLKGIKQAELAELEESLNILGGKEES